MKIAITSTGNTFDSKIDNRFGRSSYFVIHDIQTQSTEFIPNLNKEIVEGAGSAAAKLVASKGVQKVVSGEFGSKVKTNFDSLKIQLIVLTDTEMTVQQVIDLLNRHQHNS